MASEMVRADTLARGDVIRVEGEDGWFAVDSAFQEGAGGPMDLDLFGEGDQGICGWNVGPEHQIVRRT